MKYFVLLILCACVIAGNSQSTPVCADDGFEGLSNGPIVSSAWSAGYSPGQSNAMCTDFNAFAYTATNTLALIKTTPVSDYYLGTIEPSPFSGNKVVLLNQGGNYVRTRLSKTISVTSSNYVYRYAYKARLGGASPCGAGMLLFSFYDCSGNPISVITKTIQPSSVSLTQYNPDGAYWQNGNDLYTPQWIVTDANLGAYLGSCVQVRIDISPCTCGGHEGFTYFDDMCSNSIIGANPAMVASPNNSLITTGNFTSCANTATLSGLSGFSSYSWQGPAGSSISGSTLSTITTSVSGMYTLTATSGTNTFSQEVNLTVNPLANTAIASNTFVCTGQSLALSANGGGLTNYSWSTGATTSSIVVTPTATGFTNYVLTTTNSIGCAWTASTSIYLVPLAGTFLSPTEQICAGQTAVISPSGIFSTYQWDNGAITPSIAVAPASGTHVYTLSVTDPYGYISTNTIALTVLDMPHLQIVPSATAICLGQQASLTAQVSNVMSYNWNNGSTAASVFVNPTLTTTYALSGLSSQGCSATSIFTLVVNPLPQPQISGASAVCAGQPVSLSVQGNDIASYSWSNGSASSSISETPSLTTLYSVTVTSAEGCQGSSSQMVTVNALPQVQVVFSDNTLCEGEAATLAAGSNNSAALTYAWNTGATGASLTDYPSDTYTYVVTGTDANGCSSSVNTIVTVSKCLGISKNAAAARGLSVFPNPTSSNFTIKGFETGSGQIINSLGQMVYEFTLTPGNNFSVDVSDLAKGLYFVRCAEVIQKVIIK